MKEPAFADVDTSEELPIAFQLRVQHPISGARRKALELFVQFAGAEQRQHHELIEIRAAALDAELPAHRGLAAVATDQVLGLDYFLPGAGLLGDGDAHAAGILFYRLGLPAEPAFDAGQLRHSFAQRIFHQILRQAFVFLEIIIVDDFAQRRRVPIIALQIAIRNYAAHRVFRRQHPRGAHRVGDAPAIEVFHRTLRQVLALGNELRLGAPLDQSA